MESFFEKLFDWLLKEMPGVFLSIIIIIGFYYLLYAVKILFWRENTEESFGQWLFRKIKFWEKKQDTFTDDYIVSYTEEERRVAREELERHNLFQEIQNIKRGQILAMSFGSIRKNEVFRSVIGIYVETVESNILDTIMNYNLDELSTHQFNSLMLKQIDKCTTEIYMKFRDKLGGTLYDMIIDDPIKGFKEKNSIFREIFVNSIINMSNQAVSVYDHDNYVRGRDILTSMHVSLKVIVKNFERTFKEFNGELDKLL